MFSILGYTPVPDDFTNSISVIIVAIAMYYAYRIVRLSRGREFVALKGGRAPYYIIVGLFFLELDRVFDLLTNYLSAIFGYQVVVTFNDPPAALAAVFIMLGLREMYVMYERDSELEKNVPSSQEIWERERPVPLTRGLTERDPADDLSDEA